MFVYYDLLQDVHAKPCFMKKLLLLLFSLVALDGWAQVQTARGVVYHDQNGNGRRDRREPGIAEVPVSNGRQVVLTNDRGEYELPVVGHTALFVIKPAAYALPLNEQFLPQFYYLHKPEGSPSLKYAGSSPTGPLPRSVDFGLRTGQASDNFKVLVLADPQPYNTTEVDYFDRDIVQPLVGQVSQYAFGLSLGDLVGDDLDLLKPYNAAIARLQQPWYNVYGNHDMNYDVVHDTLADETFEAIYGPTTYAFNHGRVHFIQLDNVIYPFPEGTTRYTGGLREDQFEFIENDLRHVPKDHLVVLSMHIPIFNEAPFGETFRDDDRERLFALLREYPHTLSLSGHTHTQRHHFFDSTQGWPQAEPHHHYNVGTASGDWWSGQPDETGIPDALMRDGTPNGYAVLTFTGNDYVIDYRVARADTGYQMNVYAPRVIPHKKRHRGEVYVNFFMGNEQCKIEMRVPGRDWQALRYGDDQDPTLAGIRYRWDTSNEILDGNRPSNPAISKHVWRGRIPSDMPVGEQIIEVRVTDMFGRIFTDQVSVRVVAADAATATDQ